METVWRDLRDGLRGLRRSWGFSLVATVILALGIGANTAIFSIVNTVLLRPLPYPEADRIVRIAEQRPRMGSRQASIITGETFDAWRRDPQTLEHIAVYAPRAYALTGQGPPVRLRGTAVSPALFPLLGTRAALGRTFLETEGLAGSDAVVVLSHTLWEQQFAADAAIVGAGIVLDGRPRTVVGIMPASFAFPDPEALLWTPMVVTVPERRPGERVVRAFAGLAKLARGVSRTQAEAEGTTIVRRLEAEAPGPRRAGAVPGGGEPPAPAVRLVGLQDELVAGVRPALLISMTAVGLVLVIAVANLANLLLARGLSRHRELAIRAAMGAGRARLIRQLTLESLLLSVAGGLAGILLAYWVHQALPAVLPGDLPRLADLTLDGRVLAFAALISMASGLAFGLIPAFQVSSIDLKTALTESGAAGGSVGGRRATRVRGALVIAEVALAVVLLVGSALLVRSFARLVDVDPGYDPSNVLTAQLTLPETKYGRPGLPAVFFDQLIERVASQPEVRAVGIVNLLPLLPGNVVLGFEIEGQPPSAADETPRASLRVVSPGYPEAIGLDLVSGRTLADTDRATTAPVVLVNEAFVRRYLDDRAPLGARLGAFPGVSSAIVGVVGDVRHAGLDTAAEPELYVSYRQLPPALPLRQTSLVVRTQGDPLAIAPWLRDLVLAIDPALPLDSVMTMDARVASSVAQPRFYAALLTAFATLALVLAVVGLYGVVTSAIGERRAELGVRMALGADRRAILSLVLREGLTLTLCGIVLGLGAAAVATRLASGLLFGILPGDPASYTAACVALLVAAAVASYLPARGATSIDPAEALR